MNKENKREYLINELKKKAEELGRIPIANEMKNPSYKRYYREFGSWKNALKISFGEEYDSYKGRKAKYSKEELINILKQKYNELGRIPKMKDFNGGSPSITSFLNVFGSWNNVLIEVFNEETKKDKDYVNRKKYINEQLFCEQSKLCSHKNRKLKYSKEELIEILKQKQSELKRLPKVKDFNKSQPNGRTFINIFGSWNNALTIAFNEEQNHVKNIHKRGYTKEELIEILKQKQIELGRIPQMKDFNGCKPCAGTFQNIFGSWRNALVEAGLINETDKLIRGKSTTKNKYENPYQLTDHVKMIPDEDGRYKIEIIKENE